MTYEKLIINLAVTGMVHSKADTPHLPVTPEEIARDCQRCRALGASVVHLHARDAEGVPTHEPEIYARIVDRVRTACPDLIICVSTSGRRVREFEKRSAVLDLKGDLKPDMASLTLGSLNFPKEASVNEPEMITRLLEKMNERGIVPELEVFDWGMLDYAKHLSRRGLLREPLYFNLFLGSLGTLAATPQHLAGLVGEIPTGATWGATGIGRSQLPINALAIAMGGHVRVGLEDSAYMDPGKTRPASNHDMVERLVRIASAMERDIATPAAARGIIGLPAGSN